jgi:hypothetical protein
MSASQTTYRVYCYDSTNQRLDADLIRADSDEQVIAKIEAGRFGTMCEIWHGERLVAQLAAERKQA